MKIINSHVHVLKESYPNFKLKGSLEELKEDMRVSGVYKSIILSGEEHDFKFEELFKKIGKDENLLVVYTVNFKKNLKKQEKEFADLMKKGKIRGLKILLGYDYIFPSDKKLNGFYKLCEKYDLPVIFHTGDTLNGVVEKPKLKYSHPLNIDELAVERPTLKIIIAHAGNPWTVDAAEVMYKNKNVYADLSGLFLDFNDERYTSLMKRKINDLISYVGGDKLLFGTDFPLVSAEEYIGFVRSLNLTAEEQEKVFHLNAEELFKIK